MSAYVTHMCMHFHTLYFLLYILCLLASHYLYLRDIARIYSLHHKFRSGPLHCWRLQCTL